MSRICENGELPRQRPFCYSRLCLRLRSIAVAGLSLLGAECVRVARAVIVTPSRKESQNLAVAIQEI